MLIQVHVVRIPSFLFASPSRADWFPTGTSPCALGAVRLRDPIQGILILSQRTIRHVPSRLPCWGTFNYELDVFHVHGPFSLTTFSISTRTLHTDYRIFFNVLLIELFHVFFLGTVPVVVPCRTVHYKYQV